jgi:hypothetical protein
MVEKIDQKKCRDISTEIQETLAKWGKYFFYYYPKEHRIRPSEFAARHMGIVENVADLEHSILMDRIMEKEKLLKLFQDIDHGAKTVSAKIQSSGKDVVYQISMGGIQGGSQKQPEYVLGLIEQIRADTRQNEIIQALGSNFNSVYYVDVDHDKVYAYKVNSAVRSVLNDTLKEIPGYESIMAEYVGKVVLTEDRETMLYETSIENLRKQLSLKKAYQYDYRIVRDGKVKYCRAKFVNTSDGGQLHRMVAGFSDISSEKQRELERMAYVDSVTGGNNYESFKKKIRDFRQPGYLVSMDIHSFKIINSICGIIKGDETLKGIWKCIQGILEKDDLAEHIKTTLFAKENAQKIHWEGTVTALSGGIRLSMIAGYFDMKVPLNIEIYSFGAVSQIPGTREEELIAVGGGRTISYLVYSPESELSYDLFAIMDKLELIGSMGSYYDAYRLLRTQPLSGRYVLEELTVLTAASPKMRKEQRLKQLDEYRAYTYMRKRWEKYLRNHGLAEVPWEDAIDLILVFVSPIWESLCRNEIFFDDWMPELGRFLG